MDSLWNWIWRDGSLFGAHWSAWEIVGWTGNLLFTSRFFVQWWATEKHQRVVVPPVFWWISMAGSGCLLAYGFSQKNSVFIFAYLFTWIPYIRNLIIGSRVRRATPPCPSCRAEQAVPGRFCPSCGVRLAPPAA
ncbi:MAG: hypothetical protein RJA22_1638 [Verrucomicrobiota bacterium]|jgi:lipid-A-disaccharide synthase-like uncharacterized protein